MGQAEVHAEPNTLANDLGLGPVNEWGMDPEAFSISLDAVPGGQIGQSFKGLDKGRSAVGVP